MKKRLLISSVLMSAVLACALGTGTYAWYNASSAAGSLAASAEGTLNATVSGTYQAQAAELTMTFGSFTDVAMSDSSGNSLVWVNGTLVKASNSDQLTKTAKNTLSWDWKQGTTDEQKAALVGETYTITITADERVRLHAAASKQDEPNYLYSASEEISVEIEIEEDYSISVTSIDFWYSVDGSHKVAGEEKVETEDYSVTVTAVLE